MSHRATRPRRHALRTLIARHLRRARRLRRVEPDLAFEHLLLARLYERQMAMAREFPGNPAGRGSSRAVSLVSWPRPRR